MSIPTRMKWLTFREEKALHVISFFGVPADQVTNLGMADQINSKAGPIDVYFYYDNKHPYGVRILYLKLPLGDVSNE